MKSSLEKRICLICPKVPDPSWRDAFSSLDQKALGNATKKIFEYLLIPHSEQEAIGDLVDFCPDCFTIVRDIMEMQKKIQVLELMIQYKVETLGRIVLETPMRGFVGKGKASQTIWKKFRQPVIKCFLKGYLPSPSVSLILKQESSEGDQSDTSETPAEELSQIGAVIPELQSEQNSNTKNIRRPLVSNMDDGSLTTFVVKDGVNIRGEDVDDNIDIELVKVECDVCEYSEVEEGEYNLNYGDYSVSPETVDKVVPVSSELNSVNERRVIRDELSTEINPWDELNNHVKEEISSISILCEENQHLESDAEPKEILAISSKNTLEQLEKNTETMSGFQKTNETGKSVDPENDRPLKTKEVKHVERKRGCTTRPVRSSAPKRFKYSSDEEGSAAESDASDFDCEIEIDTDASEKESSASKSETETDTAKTKNKESYACKTSRKRSTLDPAVSKDGDYNPVVSTQTTRKRNPWEKRKQGIISGVKLVKKTAPEPNKYSMKCPQCDFIVTTDSMKFKIAEDADGQLFVLYEVANHFTECHNPIKLNNVSKSPNGNDCYKCSRCEFHSIILDGSLSSRSQRLKALRDLSVHYINIHNGCKEDDVTPDELKNLELGLHYFKCPEKTCNFYIVVKRTRRKPAKDRQAARMNLVRHYMNVHEHIDFSDSRKCLKCDFVTYIKESSGSNDASKKIPSDNRSNSLKRLYRHYNAVHSPPELFEALYQPSSDDYVIEHVDQDKVLKCKQCGYFTEICKIEVEGQEYIEYYHRARGNFVCHFMGTHGDSTPSSKNRSSIIPVVRKQGKCHTQSDNNAEDIPDCETNQMYGNSNPGEEVSGFNCDTVKSDPNHDLDFSTDRLPIVKQEVQNFETRAESSAEGRNELATSKSTEVKRTGDHEGSDLIEDYYQCWKCDFAVKVDYSVRNPSRNVYRQKLMVHFNATHNYEELHFGNPSALLVTVDGNECFKCPKCDFLVKVKFNPEKQRSSVQSSRSARSTLNNHYFFAHCGIEKLAVTSISK